MTDCPEIQRNPHPDFKKVEASRDPYVKTEFKQYRCPDPNWKAGQGANPISSDWKSHGIVDIDPYEEGRAAVDNYKLLISGIVPRPIGFVSTIGPDGVCNLAPFSYTQFVNHDPPIFVIGFAGSIARAKDSLKNILATKELVINMISDHFVEAANFSSINAPLGVSEWDLTGLTPIPSLKVKPARVHESIFTIECKLVDTKEWRNPSGEMTGCTIFAQGIQFHVREDALNERRNLIDPAVLRPVARLGGITYTTLDKGYEIPRPDFDQEMAKEGVKDLVKEHVDHVSEE